MLDVRARKKVSRVVDPVARLLARTGATPTMVTITGLALSVAGSVLIASGRLAVGATILGAGAALDILDGVLARVTGRETDRGALLDSFTDRLGEGGLAAPTVTHEDDVADLLGAHPTSWSGAGL